MHAAKGLEFPVVVLPCLEADFVVENPAVSAGGELGITLDYYDFDKKEIFPDVAHAANCLVNRRKQTEEELRLLYVALTRAKNHLFVVGAGQGVSFPQRCVQTDCRDKFLFLDYGRGYEKIRFAGFSRHAQAGGY